MNNIFKKWFNDKGDLKHRLNYPLNSESIVFDVGGYEGNFSDSIYKKYNSNIYCFEPVSKFYNNIRKRFDGIEKIHTFNFGLLDKDFEEEISILNDGSSIYLDGNVKEKIQIKNFTNVLNDLNIKKIDLIKINIEGGEYPLLEFFLEKKLTSQMSDIQVQFHKFVKDSEKRREKIRSLLSDTHYITYDYPFVWENWRIK
jgi:FkbM family methyltransferase